MSIRIDGQTPSTRAADAVAVAPTRPGSVQDTPVSATAAVDRVSLTGDAEGLKVMGRQLGAAPAGIDLVKVNALKAAIAEGRYPVDAQAIATRMLELEQVLEGGA